LEQRRPKNEVDVYIEAEMLEISAYRQFSTLGAFVDIQSNQWTSFGADVRFFASIVPELLTSRWGQLSPGTRLLLTQRLRLEFQRVPLKFRHQGRGIISSVTERQALLNLVTWLRAVQRPIRLFVHTRQSGFLPVLVEKLRRYGLYADFDRVVVGVCDVTSLAWSRGFFSLWKGEQSPPDFGSLRAAMTEGASSVEMEESDELAELMGQLVNQVRETGSETEKRDFLVQVTDSPLIYNLGSYFSISLFNQLIFISSCVQAGFQSLEEMVRTPAFCDKELPVSCELPRGDVRPGRVYILR
jgi:hypothetical protein